MSEVNLEQGVCLAFGGTNAREAVCVNGDIEHFRTTGTPAEPNEFFGWMARRVLQAADDGGNWVVAGFPGLVSADGKLVGPLANVSGMADRQYDLQTELTTADPAVERLLEEGFTLLATNDGPLAAQAAASRIGNNEFSRTGALIVGTGIGAGVVAKDNNYSNVHRVHGDKTEIGHLICGMRVNDTFENRYSGPALERRYNTNLRDLEHDHPVWNEVGTAAVGRLAMTLGLMHEVGLVVPTGGVGIGASDRYGPHLERFMESCRQDGNGAQKLLAPEVRLVAPGESQVFEMYGAEGVMRDHLTAGQQARP